MRFVVKLPHYQKGRRHEGQIHWILRGIARVRTACSLRGGCAADRRRRADVRVVVRTRRGVPGREGVARRGGGRSGAAASGPRPRGGLHRRRQLRPDGTPHRSRRRRFAVALGEGAEGRGRVHAAPHRRDGPVPSASPQDRAVRRMAAQRVPSAAVFREGRHFGGRRLRRTLREVGRRERLEVAPADKGLLHHRRTPRARRDEEGRVPVLRRHALREGFRKGVREAICGDVRRKGRARDVAHRGRAHRAQGMRVDGSGVRRVRGSVEHLRDREERAPFARQQLLRAAARGLSRRCRQAPRALRLDGPVRREESARSRTSPRRRLRARRGTRSSSASSSTDARPWTERRRRTDTSSFRRRRWTSRFPC